MEGEESLSGSWEPGRGPPPLRRGATIDPGHTGEEGVFARARVCVRGASDTTRIDTAAPR